MATFSDRLKELRKEKQLTIEELAEQLGSAKSTISRYENGKREPKKDFLEMLSSFFGVSISYLLGETDIRRREDLGKTSNNDEVTTIATHRINYGEDLPEEARKQLDDYLQFLREKYGKKNNDK